MATTMTVSGVRSGFSWDSSKTTNVGVNTSNAGSFSYSKNFTNNTDSATLSTVSKFYVDQFTLAASGNSEGNLYKTFDLSGTSLKDAFGDSVSFSKVRYIYVELVADDTADTSGIEVDFSSTTGMFSTLLTSPGSGTKLKIQKGGNFQICVGSGDGYGVTDSSTDLLRITNLATGGQNNTAIVRVCIAGH